MNKIKSNPLKIDRKKRKSRNEFASLRRQKGREAIISKPLKRIPIALLFIMFAAFVVVWFALYPNDTDNQIATYVYNGMAIAIIVSVVKALDTLIIQLGIPSEAEKIEGYLNKRQFADKSIGEICVLLGYECDSNTDKSVLEFYSPDKTLADWEKIQDWFLHRMKSHLTAPITYGDGGQNMHIIVLEIAPGPGGISRGDIIVEN